MSAQAGWSGSGQDAGGIANPAAAAQEVLRAFTNLVASSSRSKADLRDFEKLLVSCDDRCMSALLAHPQLWPLLRASLSNYESQWDVLGLLLNRLSMEAEGRKHAMAQGYINMMGELLAVRGPQARADKAIERLGNLACMLSVLCTDASVAQLPWLHSVCMGVRNSLDRSQIKNASGRVVMEAYAQLSAFINFLYTSVPSLARHIATCFINCSESTPLLFRVAKRLVDEPGLTGATKIVAEKSLVVLSKLSAEAPDTRFIPNQIEPWGLCHFLIKCARDCSWVQSQDSAITFLARIVFQQRHVTLDFLDLPGAAVLDTLRKAMGHKPGSSGKMGRVRTKTVKKASRVIIEKYYGRLTQDFHTNKRVCSEVAVIQTKRLRNKIAGFTTHLMKRIQRGPVRGISLKLQEEERERRLDYVPDVSALNTASMEVDPVTAEMLKAMNLTSTLSAVTVQAVGVAKPAFNRGRQ